ncbi:MAG: oligosaccharide flippase family protein [Promethearchaeota archaeon]
MIIPEKEQFLTKKYVKGSIFLLINTWFKSGLGIIANLFIAWFLIPEDLGIIKITIFFIAFIQIFRDFGFGAAVINSKKPNKELFQTYTVFQIFFGIIFTILIFVTSPFIAYIFNYPELDIILKIFSFNILICAFTAIPNIYFSKSLKFKLILKKGLIISAINYILTIIFAVLGFRYWSIIIALYIANFLDLIISWIVVKLRVSPRIHKSIFIELLKFSAPILLASLIFFGEQNYDDFIVGIASGFTILGFYSYAFTISNYLATQISSPLNSTIYPIYCDLKANPKELKNFFERNLLIISTICIFLVLFLIFNAEPLILFILTDKWAPMITVFQILCVYGLLRAWGMTCGSIYMAIGKYKIITILSFLNLFLMFPLVPYFAYSFSYIEVSYLITILHLIIIVVAFLILYRYIKFDFKKTILYQLISATVSFIPTILLLFFYELNIIYVLVSALSSITIYFLCLNILLKRKLYKYIKTGFEIFIGRKLFN